MSKLKNNKALLEAIRYSNISEAKEQLDNGASPNYIADIGMPAPMPLLAIAVELVFQASKYKPIKLSKTIEMVKLLLERGANANAIYYESKTKDFPMTPWKASLMNGDYKVVELLLKHGADANYLHENSLSPLETAMRSFHKDNKIIKLLLDKHADFNYVTPGQKYTSWLYCGLSDDIETVKLFLNAGADINYKNNDGISLLSLAMGDGRSDHFPLKSIKKPVIEYLLNNDADFSCVSKNCVSALSFAKKSADPELITLLNDWMDQNNSGDIAGNVNVTTTYLDL